MTFLKKRKKKRKEKLNLQPRKKKGMTRVKKSYRRISLVAEGVRLIHLSKGFLYSQTISKWGGKGVRYRDIASQGKWRERLALSWPPIHLSTTYVSSNDKVPQRPTSYSSKRPQFLTHAQDWICRECTRFLWSNTKTYTESERWIQTLRCYH